MFFENICGEMFYDRQHVPHEHGVHEAEAPRRRVIVIVVVVEVILCMIVVSHRWDLNPRPGAYEASALPAELLWLAICGGIIKDYR